MRFEVFVVPRALRQSEDARAWWSAHRSAAPTLLGDELDRALARLADNPSLGAPWPQREGGRRLVLARVGFLVLYRARMRARRVEVLALWHGGRGGPPPGM